MPSLAELITYLWRIMQHRVNATTIPASNINRATPTAAQYLLSAVAVGGVVTGSEGVGGEVVSGLLSNEDVAELMEFEDARSAEDETIVEVVDVKLGDKVWIADDSVLLMLLVGATVLMDTLVMVVGVSY